MSKFNCDKCSGKLDVYYGKWCPRCDKPEIQKTKTLNLIKVFRYLIAHDEISQRDKKNTWSWLAECGSINNDSYNHIEFSICSQDLVAEFEDGEMLDEDEKSFLKVSQAIEKHFGKDDDILWEISW